MNIPLTCVLTRQSSSAECGARPGTQTKAKKARMAPAAAPAPPGAEPATGAALALGGAEQGTAPRLSPNTDADRRASCGRLHSLSMMQVLRKITNCVCWSTFEHVAVLPQVRLR